MPTEEGPGRYEATIMAWSSRGYTVYSPFPGQDEFSYGRWEGDALSHEDAQHKAMQHETINHYWTEFTVGDDKWEPGDVLRPETLARLCGTNNLDAEHPFHSSKGWRTNAEEIGEEYNIVSRRTGSATYQTEQLTAGD